MIEALIVRGSGQNKKWEKSGKVRSKSRLGKMSVPFVMRRGIGRNIVLS